jgi:aspartate/glutamate racemase
LPALLEIRDALSILPSIGLVKDGWTDRAGETLAPAVQVLFGRGAAAVILACTGTPIALDAIASPLRVRRVDSTRALALACVVRWFGSVRR